MNFKLKRASWFLFGLLCLLIFTVLKLPRDPIKASIRDLLTQALAQQGASFSVGEEDLSIFLLPSYQMKKVTLTLPPPAETAHVDRITLSPTFLPLFLGRWGGEIQIQQGAGRIQASVSNRKSFFAGSFQTEQFDLGKLGLLPLLLGIQGSGILDGKGSVSTDLQALNQSEGTLQLQLSKLSFEPQSIAGFALPKLAVSEASVQLAIQQGKAKIITCRVGKAGSSLAPGDDIRATVTGDITLGKTPETSTLNLKTNFAFSETILKSFMLLDALLGPGKQSDGSYSFALTGSVMNPISQPLAQTGGNP